MYDFISGISNPIPLVYIFILVPVLYRPDYCSFVIGFEIRKGEASNFILFQGPYEF